MQKNSSDWKIRIGEFDLIVEDQKYKLEIGYQYDRPDLYIRVWYENGDFAAGSWIDGDHETLLNRLSYNAINACIEYAKRVEKLVVFI
jgi:hypothetical protein